MVTVHSKNEGCEVIMSRKTNKDFEQERRKLFHVRKVSKPDDLLDRKLIELCQELNIKLRKNKKQEGEK